MNNIPRIVYCRCDYPQLANQQTRGAVLDLLGASSVDWLEVDDLCHMAARRDRRLAEIITPDTVLLACFARTVRWLLGRAGVELPDTTRLINLRGESPEDAVRILADEIARSASAAAGSGQPRQGHVRWERADEWTAWFPVLDYDRCRQCGQCLNFCLFGVYALDERGGVEVARPENCKINCPACARICPQVAIIFPKEAHGPINGAPVTEADAQREDLAVPVDRIRQTDVYAALRRRGTAAAGERFAVPDETTEGPATETTSGGCSCGSGPAAPSDESSAGRSVSGSPAPPAATPETAADSSAQCSDGACDCQCDCDDGFDDCRCDCDDGSDDCRCDCGGGEDSSCCPDRGAK